MRGRQDKSLETELIANSIVWFHFLLNPRLFQELQKYEL